MSGELRHINGVPCHTHLMTAVADLAWCIGPMDRFLWIVSTVFGVSTLQAAATWVKRLSCIYAFGRLAGTVWWQENYLKRDGSCVRLRQSSYNAIVLRRSPPPPRAADES